MILLLAITANAQKLEDQTLLTIDGNKYDAGTFMRVYLKNLDIVQDESQKDLDNYMDLYINYRLKLLQAQEMGLDNDEEYKEELASYRSTLAEGYLTDNEVTDELIKEAYERTINEVNASHILIKVDKDAAPADTLKAYSKIKLIKNKLDRGADFDELARNESEGPSAGVDGKIGWFGAFRMVYPFENAAFDTPVGEVSDIFRTDFGYHVLKVNDKRPAPGEVAVAHIMTYDRKPADSADAEARIRMVYEQLESGKEFGDMAKEFSEDINSSRNGGRIGRFGTGGLNSPEFEEAAFALDTLGTYTKPIKTEYGWHIIRLLEKHPVAPYEKIEEPLRNKIKSSPRSRKITESFTNSIKEKYNVTIPKYENYSKEFPLITDSIMTSSWEIPLEKTKRAPLFTIEGKPYYRSDFWEYAYKRHLKDPRKFKSLEDKIKIYFTEFSDRSLVDYYEANLDRDNKEFAFILNEYKEGLLLFELMEEKVWEKAKTDSLGQREFYENNKDKYSYGKRLDLILTQNTSEETAQQVQELLEQGKTVDEIKAQINSTGNTKTMISTGIVEQNYSRLPEDFEVKEGVSDIYKKDNAAFHKVIKVNEILDPTPKSFEESRGAVINDYQQALEKEWMESLRDGREIKVNERVFKKTKKAIAKKAA
ncbi:peptidyl-prolyl cis-trans isomerase [Nonlabens ponticola]|uniref:Peptidyl-prolyl cis-trans isomerase n=2 Tax=Nonlabens ponticola TaxID=2496866 RepID=A0A3S9N1F2_9FLAO|nr:peptidyl-prolyl cis-trans isomerase [Nonlabens ponticola]